MGKQIMYARIQRNLSAETVFGEADDKRYAVPPLFYRYITKKTASLSEKDVLAVFRLRLFFSQLCIIHSFLKNATTTAPGPTWVPITLPTVV